MSVMTLSRFVAHLALDYNKLAKYLEDPEGFLPTGEDSEETETKIIQACGDLTEDEILMIRNKDWGGMFDHIAKGRPRPLPQEQGSYPDP